MTGSLHVLEYKQKVISLRFSIIPLLPSMKKARAGQEEREKVFSKGERKGTHAHLSTGSESTTEDSRHIDKEPKEQNQEDGLRGGRERGRSEREVKKQTWRRRKKCVSDLIVKLPN